MQTADRSYARSEAGKLKRRLPQFTDGHFFQRSLYFIANEFFPTVLTAGRLQQQHDGAGLMGASTPCLPGTLTGMSSDHRISQPSQMALSGLSEAMQAPRAERGTLSIWSRDCPPRAHNTHVEGEEAGRPTGQCD